MQAAPPSLRALDRALPSVTRFAAALRPALRSAPQPAAAQHPASSCSWHLFAQPGLPALLEDLAPALARYRASSDSSSRCQAPHPRQHVPHEERDPDPQPGSSRTAPTAPVTRSTSTPRTPRREAAASWPALTATASPRAGITANGTTINGFLPGLGPIIGKSPKIEGIRPTWLGYVSSPVPA